MKVKPGMNANVQNSCIIETSFCNRWSQKMEVYNAPFHIAYLL